MQKLIPTIRNKNTIVGTEIATANVMPNNNSYRSFSTANGVQCKVQRITGD
jgi:hypothetical protein